MKSLLLASLVSVAGCASTIVPVAVPLDCPEPLEIAKAPPHIKAKIDAMRQSDPDLYEFFLRRAKLQAARRETLQNICRSGHVTN